MQDHMQGGSTGNRASGTGQEWLGNSDWQGPQVKISSLKSWPALTAVSYYRDGGETIWRVGRHRLTIPCDPLPGSLLQVEQGRTKEIPLIAPGTLAFCPADTTLRLVSPGARVVNVLWDTDLHSALLPELGTATCEFEFQYPLQDRLLSQIVMSLAHEIECGFADKILVESLGTALFIRLAQHFVGHLPLPTRGGLSLERLRRVRDYVEEHLDDDLSLTILADIACLSPYHFSRSFKQAIGVGPQRYVMERRIARAKTLMCRTRQPLASIALEVGFTDQSHLTQVFRQATGMTPGRFRAALV